MHEGGGLVERCKMRTHEFYPLDSLPTNSSLQEQTHETHETEKRPFCAIISATSSVIGVLSALVTENKGADGQKHCSVWWKWISENFDHNCFLFCAGERHDLLHCDIAGCADELRSRETIDSQPGQGARVAPCEGHFPRALLHDLRRGVRRLYWPYVFLTVQKSVTGPVLKGVTRAQQNIFLSWVTTQNNSLSCCHKVADCASIGTTRQVLFMGKFMSHLCVRFVN